MRDRIGETAGPTHDRNRAVTKAVHLVEPARLVLRRHQESVARAFDPVRQRFVVAAEEPGATAEFCGEPREELFIVRFAGADYGNTNVVIREQLGQCVGEQVETFLRREPAHDAEQRNATLSWLQ